jgi:G3E family GTPase
MRALDLVIDHLNTLNDLTPKIKCKGRNGVDPNLIFGVDSKLFHEAEAREYIDVVHNDEVETVTIYRGPSGHVHEHHPAEKAGHAVGGEGGQTVCNGTDADVTDIDVLIKALECLSKESVWRIKGFVRLQDGAHILNWAFGRFELTKVEGTNGAGSVRLTTMGERGEVKPASRKFAAALGADLL